MSGYQCMFAKHWHKDVAIVHINRFKNPYFYMSIRWLKLYNGLSSVFHECVQYMKSVFEYTVKIVIVSIKNIHPGHSGTLSLAFLRG